MTPATAHSVHSEHERVDTPSTQPETGSLVPDEHIWPAFGRAPVAALAAGYVGALVGLVLLGAGVVAMRDAVLAAGWVRGSSWIVLALDWIDGLTFRTWMVPAGVVCVLVGVWWVLLAATPRRKTSIAVDARTSVWIDPRDVARITTATAETVPGVLHARSRATRKKIKVSATVTGSDSGEARVSVTEAVRTALAPLKPAPKISVRPTTATTTRRPS